MIKVKHTRKLNSFLKKVTDMATRIAAAWYKVRYRSIYVLRTFRAQCPFFSLAKTRTFPIYSSTFSTNPWVPMSTSKETTRRIFGKWVKRLWSFCVMKRISCHSRKTPSRRLLSLAVMLVPIQSKYREKNFAFTAWLNAFSSSLKVVLIPVQTMIATLARLLWAGALVLHHSRTWWQ